MARLRPLRLAVHVVFWAVVLVFYTFYFGREDNDYGQSLLFVCLLLPVTVATTYFLTHFLIPRYLLRRRYGFFVLYAVYTLVGSIYAQMSILVGAFIFIAKYEVAAMNPVTFDALELVVGMYFVVFLAVATNLLERWYAIQTAHARLAQAKAEAELHLKEAELKLLKGQIHPHFLFNTLNNLYGLALAKSDKTPDAVLRLADLLDYMLYRTGAPRVPLTDEVAHLWTYVELEKLRYDDRVTVTVETCGPVDEAAIAPMLLIPFVENCFKHGVSHHPGPAWVNLRLALDSAALTFTAANSKAPTPGTDARGYTEGIGLTNVRRRLDLLYPDAHTLTIHDAPERFDVTLHLDLDAYHANDLPHRG